MYAIFPPIHLPPLSIQQDNCRRGQYAVLAHQVGRSFDVDPVDCEIAQELMGDAGEGAFRSLELLSLAVASAMFTVEEEQDWLSICRQR